MEVDKKRKSVEYEYLNRNDDKIRKGFDNYMIQK